MKKLRLTPEKCVGCKLCELNCSFAHYGVFSHDLSNLRVVTVEDTADFRPYLCLQCEERRCIEVCPVGVLSVDEKTGAVVADQDLCVFCEACVSSCKYKGIRVIKYQGGEKLAVCDLCEGGEPRCAGACREGAILFE